MTSVGIKELRQNLSTYLSRARDGEVVEVTDRGNPVARLVPIGDDEDPIRRLRAEGMVHGPGAGRVGDLPPPAEPVPGSESLSETLRKMREQERY
jgi:prevent-host-death family protein